MAQKDWSDYFAASYGTGGFSEGMKMGFENWKQKQQLSPEYTIQQAIPLLAMTGQTDAINNLMNYYGMKNNGQQVPTNQNIPESNLEITGMGITGGKPRLSIGKKTKLTESEQNVLTAGERMGSSLKTFRGAVEGGLLDKFKQQIQTNQAFPYLLVKDQKLQSVKNALDNLKADIPFLRGGKQLTPMEARRIDILLDPTGKTRKTMLENISKFEDEFGYRKYLATQGTRGSNTDGWNQTSGGIKYRVEQ